MCRSTLTKSNDGCVPIDLFGYGAPSQASINYILGHRASGLPLRSGRGELSANGSVLSLPAGNLSVAVGAGLGARKSSNQTADEISQRIRTGAGIQGYPIGLINTLGGFERTNPQPASGKYDVTEVFTEVEVPLLKDQLLAKSLTLNGAARYVDYSTSGNVVPWKAGAVWEPTDWLRFRGTRSRDIRAPNLGELYRGSSQGTANVVDPFRNNANVAVLTGSIGNPNLTPEIAQGKTIGVC